MVQITDDIYASAEGRFYAERACVAWRVTDYLPMRPVVTFVESLTAARRWISRRRVATGTFEP